MDSIYESSVCDKLALLKFEKKSIVDEDANLYIYDLNYYESGLNEIEQIEVGERKIGSILIKRDYVTTSGADPYMFAFHTNIVDESLFPEDHKATIAIVHGFGENSDIHLESAMQYALNGFDIHLIDLRGYGYSGGYRMQGNRIHDYHHEVSALLRQVNPKIPLFLYAHSMGGLTVVSYLLNNP